MENSRKLIDYPSNVRIAATASESTESVPTAAPAAESIVRWGPHNRRRLILSRTPCIVGIKNKDRKVIVVQVLARARHLNVGELASDARSIVKAAVRTDKVDIRIIAEAANRVCNVMYPNTNAGSWDRKKPKVGVSAGIPSTPRGWELKPFVHKLGMTIQSPSGRSPFLKRGPQDPKSILRISSASSFLSWSYCSRLNPEGTYEPSLRKSSVPTCSDPPRKRIPCNVGSKCSLTLFLNAGGCVKARLKEIQLTTETRQATGYFIICIQISSAQLNEEC